MARKKCRRSGEIYYASDFKTDEYNSEKSRSSFDFIVWIVGCDRSFDEDVDDFYAQQYASNRMAGVNLPDGADAEIDPPYGATGEIFRYVVKGDLPIKELTAIQDWVIERELVSVPGVANVVSFGGEEKFMR